MSIYTDLAPRKNIDETLAARAKAIKDFKTGLEFLMSSQRHMSAAGFGRFVFAKTFTDRHLAYHIEDIEFYRGDTLALLSAKQEIENAAAMERSKNVGTHKEGS